MNLNKPIYERSLGDHVTVEFWPAEVRLKGRGASHMDLAIEEFLQFIGSWGNERAGRNITPNKLPLGERDLDVEWDEETITFRCGEGPAFSLNKRQAGRLVDTYLTLDTNEIAPKP